ncbi:MAG TPA: cytochrome c biogenesis protein CcsA [Candidatus Eisenbacteria bacterium]|nr:cytochrome c biogenesis protein CcsA [Candidatus Eisenbacteria bacterium]
MIDVGAFIRVILMLLPVLYGLALIAYVVTFANNQTTLRRLARPLLFIALGANAVYFFGFTFYFQHLPFVNVFQVLGAIGFAIAVIYVWVESRAKSPHTGPFILALVLVFQILNTAFPRLDRYVPEILRSTMFNIHVSAAILGYSAFAVAAVYGLLYLLQYRVIRNKSFGLVFQRLPSLDILDHMNLVASSTGFMFLSIAIVAGIWWSHEVFGGVEIDPKVFVAMLTWVIYGLALFGRRFVSWRGPRMAYSSLFGFLVILFSLFAVNFFMTKFHVFVS